MSDDFDSIEGTLRVHSSVSTRGCGIYEVGDTERCYTKLFITDSGCVLPVNHRMVSNEDLMTVYGWGYDDGKSEPDGNLLPKNAVPMFNALASLIHVFDMQIAEGLSTEIELRLEKEVANARDLLEMMQNED